MSSVLQIPDFSPLEHVRIVMVNTTLPANIGAALRAMKTMGIRQLVLVAPKSYPHPDITALAAGAADLIDSIVIVDDLATALADCHLVFATSARSRTIPWVLLEARQAAALAITRAHQQQKIAVVFGREDRGLTNEELALAHYHVTIPVNSEYGVLNVAQAIQVICYELRMACLNGYITPQEWDEPLVTQEQMAQFYPHLEQMLTDIEFLDPQNPRLLPLRLKRLFGRIQLDKIEYHLLRGVMSRVQALVRQQWQPQSPSTTNTKKIAHHNEHTVQSAASEVGTVHDV